MLKNTNRFASNAVFHAMKKTGFVGAGVNGRHSLDLSEFEKRKKAPKKSKKKLFEEDAEPDADEFNPDAGPDGDVDDEVASPLEHAKKIAKHAKKLRSVAADIGSRIDEMRKMGLE